eukprot:GHVU01213429.1.p2 GENE.GHVU01213429.1~~GHVU01213429.1.p2  ORF type:complete len:170 (-),score=19.07 GHVU01213429.1:865-1374(-)
MDLRAKKSGLALKIQKQLEEKYDEEDSIGTPARVVEWVNRTMEGEHPPCTGKTPRRIMFHWRDGVCLCKFINKLLESAGKKPVKLNINANTAFVAMNNIENFNKGAVAYGLRETDTFNSIDLYECNKGPLLNVMNCLNKLGFEANKQGFTPVYEAVEAPGRDMAVWGDT